MSRPHLIRPTHEWIAGPGVRGVTLDSRPVKPEHVFRASAGRVHYGHRPILEAICARAAAVIRECRPTAVSGLGDIPYVAVANVHREASRIAGKLFDRPFRQSAVVGVTATNGKITVSYPLRHFLRAGLNSTGLSGSVLVDALSDRQRPQLATPKTSDFQRIVKITTNTRAAAAVASSHVLVPGRAIGINFAGVMFTNHSRDHLDVHGTMKAYAQAKARWFAQLGNKSPAVTNANDPWGEWMAHPYAGMIITFDQSAGIVRCNRDLGKYPGKMGRAAAHYCQRIRITTENPCPTPLECLIQAILAGISDRRVATVLPGPEMVMHALKIRGLGVRQQGERVDLQDHEGGYNIYVRHCRLG